MLYESATPFHSFYIDAAKMMRARSPKNASDSVHRTPSDDNAGVQSPQQL